MNRVADPIVLSADATLGYLPRPFSRPGPGWTRLNKPEQPEQPISRKTLEIEPDSPPKEKLPRSPEHRRLHLRTIRAHLFNRPEPRWTRLNKPEQPEHPISRKTLEIEPDSPPKEKLPRSPEHHRLHLHTTRTHLCNRPELRWTRLNEPERPEHPIPCKTLEIEPDSPPKEKYRRTPEHRCSQESHSPGSPLPRTACDLVGTRTERSGIVKAVASGGAPDCEGRGWLRARLS